MDTFVSETEHVLFCHYASGKARVQDSERLYKRVRLVAETYSAKYY